MMTSDLSLTAIKVSRHGVSPVIGTDYKMKREAVCCQNTQVKYIKLNMMH